MFYSTVGRIPKGNYGVRFIARSYVLYSDGTVFYSSNNTNGSSISSAAGVENGYICRSVISIASSIAKFAYANNLVGISSIISSVFVDGKVTWASGATNDNGTPILQFICNNADAINSLVSQ